MLPTDRMFLGQDRNGEKETNYITLDELQAQIAGGNVIEYDPESSVTNTPTTLSPDANTVYNAGVIGPTTPAVKISGQLPYDYCTVAVVGEPTGGEIIMPAGSDNTLFFVWCPPEQSARTTMATAISGGTLNYPYVMAYIVRAQGPNDGDGNITYTHMMTSIATDTTLQGSLANVSATDMKATYVGSQVSLKGRVAGSYVTHKSFDATGLQLHVLALNNVEVDDIPLAPFSITNTLGAIEYTLPEDLPVNSFLQVQSDFLLNSEQIYEGDTIHIVAPDKTVVYRGGNYIVSLIEQNAGVGLDILGGVCRAVYGDDAELNASIDNIDNPQNGQYVLQGPNITNYDSVGNGIETFNIYFYSADREAWIKHNTDTEMKVYTSQSALLSTLPPYTGAIALVTYYDNSSGKTINDFYVGHISSWISIAGSVPRTLDDLPEGAVNKYLNPANLKNMWFYEMRGSLFSPLTGDELRLASVDDTRQYIAAKLPDRANTLEYFWINRHALTGVSNDGFLHDMRVLRDSESDQLVLPPSNYSRLGAFCQKGYVGNMKYTELNMGLHANSGGWNNGSGQFAFYILGTDVNVTDATAPIPDGYGLKITHGGNNPYTAIFEYGNMAAGVWTTHSTLWSNSYIIGSMDIKFIIDPIAQTLTIKGLEFYNSSDVRVDGIFESIGWMSATKNLYINSTDTITFGAAYKVNRLYRLTTI